jgi:hypothetical protein
LLLDDDNIEKQEEDSKQKKSKNKFLNKKPQKPLAFDNHNKSQKNEKLKKK